MEGSRTRERDIVKGREQEEREGQCVVEGGYKEREGQCEGRGRWLNIYHSRASHKQMSNSVTLCT